MWDQRFGEDGWAYGTEPNDLVAATTLPDGPVLCLAEGEGRNAVHLARRGHAVTAVDISAVGLAKARGLAERHGVSIHTEVADLATYAIGEGAWAAVVLVWAHLPPPVRARVHAAAVRGLRPGGILVLEAYTPDQLRFRTGGPQVTELLMTLDGLRTELAGLELLHAVELERDVHEGRYHDGRSAVVQVVGRRP
jgi:SAM-dependent methyltransferase